MFQIIYIDGSEDAMCEEEHEEMLSEEHLPLGDLTDIKYEFALN